MSRKLDIQVLRSAFSTCMLLVLVSAAWAQNTGSITVNATDSTGAAIANASVMVKHIDTNNARTAETGSDGKAFFPGLAIGSYEVTIDRPGFARVTRRGIVLQLDQNAVVVQALKLAAVSETVTVTEDAPVLNTTSAEVGIRFDERRLSDLPTSGLGALGGGFRDVFSFGLSAPGVSQINSGNTGFAAGTDYSVNGARLRSNNFTVDGQDVNDPSVSGVQVGWNNPDAVQEFRMITNQFSAEYGRAAGSVVNVATKSGTNAFHGSLFWFHNSNPLNTRNNLDKAGGLTKTPLRIENQIGGTAGGPILRDRTFFFGSLQRWTDRQLGSGATITGVPTDAGRTILQANGGSRITTSALLGNLPAASSATGTVRYCFNPVAWNGPGAPPQARLSSGSFICSTAGAPNTPAAGWTLLSVPVGSLTGANRVKFDDWQWSSRVDHKLSDNHSLNGRYMYNDSISEGSGQATPTGLANVSPSRAQAAILGVTSTLSQRWLNEFRLAWNRLATSTDPQDPTALLIPSIEIPELGMTGFNAVGTRTAIGYGVNLPQSRRNNTYQIINNMTYSRGSHTMKFGGDIRRTNLASDFNPNVRGQLRYSTLTNYVADFADQTAQLSAPLPGGQLIMHYDWTDWYFFLQDDWKVTPHFTLNLGLRYELPGNSVDSIYNTNDRIVEAAGGNELFRYNSRPDRDTNNLMPRFGFNWNPQFSSNGLMGWLTGGDKTVIRGGFTRAFDYAFLNMALNITSAFPFQAAFSVPSTPNTFAGLFNQTVSTSNAQCFPVTPGVAIAKCLNQTRVAPEFRSPYSDQYSLELQREIGGSSVVRFGYIATKGTGLYQSVEGNPVTRCGTAACPRVDNSQGVIRVRGNTAGSIYHALQASFDRKYKNGLSGGVHYT